MEGSSSLGTWVAYALIVLFLLVLGFVVARAVALYSLLVVAPLHGAWKWLTRSGARADSASADEAPSDTDPRSESL